MEANQLFTRFYGNDSLKETLTRMLVGERFPHALLLEGEAGLGKRTLAGLVAAALLCDEKPPMRPCGLCPNCHKAFTGGHPDIHRVAGEKSFGIGLVREMREAIHSVKSAQITHAVRDTKLGGEEIKKDEILGIFEGDIVAHGTDMHETVQALLEKMVDDEDAVISFYFGEDVKEADAKALSEEMEDLFDEYDVEVYNGGQPVYDYIISVE